MSHTGSVGAELHACSLREGGLDGGELLENAAPRPIQVGRFIEDDINEGHPEHRLRPDGGYLRQPLKSGDKRKRDLILDELR